MSRLEIQKNLELFEEEKKERLKNPWYKLRFNIYKFNKWWRSKLWIR